ncbi:MAG: hypothetical protein HY720_16675 [Planctomycetes bacterium]|nr:hypothetical protein [Planctomycetota bacterium]
MRIARKHLSLAAWAFLAAASAAGGQQEGAATPEALFEKFRACFAAADWKGLVALYEPRALQRDFGKRLLGFQEELDLYEELPEGKEKQMKKIGLQAAASYFGAHSPAELRSVPLPKFAATYLSTRMGQEMKDLMSKASVLRVEREGNGHRGSVFYRYIVAGTDAEGCLLVHRTGDSWYFAGSEPVELSPEEEKAGQGAGQEDGQGSYLEGYRDVLARSRDLAKAKNYPAALALLGDQLRKLGEEPGIRLEIEEIKEERRRDAEIFLAEARERLESGDRTRAKRKVEVVLWWSPDDAEALELLRQIEEKR